MGCSLFLIECGIQLYYFFSHNLLLFLSLLAEVTPLEYCEEGDGITPCQKFLPGTEGVWCGLADVEHHGEG